MKGINPTKKALDASGMRFGIAATRFNETIVEHLLEEALSILEGHGVPASAVEVVRVPGAFELPLAARLLIDAKCFDAIIALGCVIRGETPHFDYVAGECARGLAALALEHRVPVLFGVLTTDTVEQAQARSQPGGCNKGADAALAAIEMVMQIRKMNAG